MNRRQWGDGGGHTLAHMKNVTTHTIYSESFTGHRLETHFSIQYEPHTYRYSSNNNNKNDLTNIAFMLVKIEILKMAEEVVN